MIFSQQSLFSDDQAITASAASTNYLDMGAAGTPYGGSALSVDLGKGNKLKLNVQVTTAFATLTSLKVAVQVDDNSSFSSATTVLETEAIAAASLVAGYVFNIDEIPLKTNERYVRLYYTVAGSNATAGNIHAGIVMGQQTNGI